MTSRWAGAAAPLVLQRCCAPIAVCQQEEQQTSQAVTGKHAYLPHACVRNLRLCAPDQILQTSWLNNSVAEDLGDQEALEAELERELAAAEENEEAAAAPTPATGKKKVSCESKQRLAVLSLTWPVAAEVSEAAAGALLHATTPSCIATCVDHSHRSLLQGKHAGTPTQEDEQQMLAQMRAEGLMATPAGAAPLAAAAAASTPLPEGSGGPPPKEGAGARRIRREVFLKAPDGSWQVRPLYVQAGRFVWRWWAHVPGPPACLGPGISDADCLTFRQWFAASMACCAALPPSRRSLTRLCMWAATAPASCTRCTRWAGGGWVGGGRAGGGFAGCVVA